MGNRTKWNLLTKCLSLAVPLMVATPALAQEESTGDVSDEIIVTAQRREENLQEVPAAIDVFTQSAMEDIGASDFGDLVNSAPGVELRANQAGAGSVAVRGIAELNDANLTGGTGAAVGFYLDELPLTMAGIFPDVKSFDIQRVEILRGPQGTLYGEGSLAGTVRLITNQPDADNFEGRVFGSYATQEGGEPASEVNGMINVPIIDGVLAMRAVGFYQNLGGYIDTPQISGGPTMEDANSNETTGGRLAFRLTPNNRLAATFSVLRTEAERGAPNVGTTDFINTVSVPTSNEDTLTAYNLTVDYDMGFADFVSSTSTFDRETTGVVDQGGLVPGVNFVFGLLGIPIVADGVFIDQVITSEALAQEFRLVSSSEGPLQWTLGAFYKQQEFRYAFDSDAVPSVPGPVWAAIDAGVFGGLLGTSEGFTTDSTGEAEQFALYGEASYDFTDRLNLLIGARWFEESRSSSSTFDGVFPALQALLAGILPGDPTFPIPGTFSTDADDNLINPRVTATYEWSDDVRTYVTYSQGFRSGGQNDLYIFVPGSTQVSYDSETLTNYEFGLKSTLFDGRARFNASLFHMEWEDLQAVVGEGTGGIGETIGNIGEAHSDGVEFELVANATDNLSFRFAATMLEAETDVPVTVPDPSGGAPIVVPSGTRIPKTSELSANASVMYTREVAPGLEGFARLSYTHVGDATSNLARSFASPAADRVPSYDLVDLRFGLEGEQWRLDLFAENLFDETVRLSALPNLDLGTGDIRYVLGRPRTIGVSLRYAY